MTLTVGADEIALVGLALAAVPPGWCCTPATAGGSTLGVLTAVVLSGSCGLVSEEPLRFLPLPNSIANIYQGLLPTWNYDFWFAVNKDAPGTSSILGRRCPRGDGTRPGLVVVTFIFATTGCGRRGAGATSRMRTCRSP